jgi:hypothetical protein
MYIYIYIRVRCGRTWPHCSDYDDGVYLDVL